MSVKLTGTPSMNARDQEILREPRPFSVAVRSVGAGGRPDIRRYEYHLYKDTVIPYIITVTWFPLVGFPGKLALSATHLTVTWICIVAVKLS